MQSFQQKLFAIIVAGGAGTRMKSDTPKQFIPLGNRPILMHTVSRFLNFSEEIELILVLPEKEIQTWENLCSNFTFDQKKVKVVKGGNTRFQSVKNGLQAIDAEEGLVAIHDGVRPFVKQSIIELGFQKAAAGESNIAVISIKDSIRKIKGNGKNKSVDREDFRLVQTPQTFQLDVIRKAYQHALSDQYADDSSVAEDAGEKILLIEGSPENIKITTPEDLAMSEAIFKHFKY